MLNVSTYWVNVSLYSPATVPLLNVDPAGSTLSSGTTLNAPVWMEVGFIVKTILYSFLALSGLSINCKLCLVWLSSVNLVLGQRSPMRTVWGKKSGNFKTNIHLDSIESFSNCLSSSIPKILRLRALHIFLHSKPCKTEIQYFQRYLHRIITWASERCNIK